MNTPSPTNPKSEKSPTSRQRPIPPAFEGIQVNGCKTPGCANFGIPPREGAMIRGRYAEKNGDDYVVIGTGSENLKCKKCNRFSTLKSNKGIYEELQRQGSYFLQLAPFACDCGNTAQFRRYGKTRSGSDRWQCLACKKTKSFGKPAIRQRASHKNALVFDLLINKSPINRMMEIADLGVAALYGKID